MKARIPILAASGSLAIVASPANAGVHTTDAVRQLQFVVMGDGGGGGIAPTRRAPAALNRGVTKPPWKTPNRWQVWRNSI